MAGRPTLGLEYDGVAASFAAAKSGRPVAGGSVNQLPFGDGALAGYVSLDVLCHGGVEPALALKEAHRCLNAGAIAVFNLPAYQWMLSAHDRRVHNVRRFTRRQAGALLARHELLLCIDGDALLDPHAAAWMVRHFQRDPRLGAVTGNPRIRNRSTLLGRLQVGEFSMIVGLIKRAQSQLGGLFCVSGVIGCFRRSALHAVGYWDPTRLTEDIDITWRLQRSDWRVIYEPHALVWILMPETLRGLWRQRRRWADGGLEVLRANLDLLRTPRQWRLLPLLLEPLASLLWANLLGLLLLLAPLAPLLQGHLALSVAGWLPHGFTVWLLLACVLQFAVSFWLDRPYDVGLRRIGYWMIWYPAAYWLLSFAATLVACWRLPFRRGADRARWVSPDRGVRA